MWGSPRGELEMGNWGVEKEEYIKDALCHGPTMGPRKEEKTLFSIMGSSLLPWYRTQACFY